MDNASSEHEFIDPETGQRRAKVAKSSNYPKPPSHEKYQFGELGVIRYMMENYVNNFIYDYNSRYNHFDYYDNPTLLHKSTLPQLAKSDIEDIDEIQKGVLTSRLRGFRRRL